ncbi:uncharacterized protein EV420DRAFT_1637962 [Desarmillaria tabescens]|uniref:Uncharacterized protein n=1 Tax=Armillaria tabescens TaxID=1929756 RepID=A0AA39TMQ4_ARMTA|nr:uncharacterized protein EV420DRAFT_1637962 [Desarmillaria tabescens]KAK0464397.1 hypothetical protein EV420DRAFT_1637962 [Desarmillaria tabescens]
MASVAVIADSISALSKSINQVFSEAEKSTSDKLERAQNVAQDARNERDDALKALHAAELETQEWKQKVKQAEMTITYQNETVSQLRREAAQWKDQSRNWQEHFLRVEQERCTLSSRLDELVSERLLPAPVAPLTPISRYADHSGSPVEQTSSASVKNITLLPLSPPEGDPPTPRNATTKARKPPSTHAKPTIKSKPPITVLKTSTTPNPFTEPSTSKRTGARTPVRTETQQPRSKVIRRVRAVFHVKQEDDSGEDDQEEEDDELSEQEDASYRPPRRPSLRAVKDDDSDLFGGDEEDDEEEDELMIGPDDNDDLDKLPSHKRPPPTPAPPASPPKKRRISTATARPKATGKKS